MRFVAPRRARFCGRGASSSSPSSADARLDDRATTSAAATSDERGVTTGEKIFGALKSFNRGQVSLAAELFSEGSAADSRPHRRGARRHALRDFGPRPGVVAVDVSDDAEPRSVSLSALVAGVGRDGRLAQRKASTAPSSRSTPATSPARATDARAPWSRS